MRFLCAMQRNKNQWNVWKYFHKTVIKMHQNSYISRVELRRMCTNFSDKFASRWQIYERGRLKNLRSISQFFSPRTWLLTRADKRAARVSVAHLKLGSKTWNWNAQTHGNTSLPPSLSLSRLGVVIHVRNWTPQLFYTTVITRGHFSPRTLLLFIFGAEKRPGAAACHGLYYIGYDTLVGVSRPNLFSWTHSNWSRGNEITAKTNFFIAADGELLLTE